jgi:hypothetical protein
LSFSSSTQPGEFLVRAENDTVLSQGVGQLRAELPSRFRCYVDPMRYA